MRACVMAAIVGRYRDRGGPHRRARRRLDVPRARQIDARGALVTDSYVNPHLHLCKVWTLPMMSEEALNAYRAAGMAKSAAAIDLASKVKESYDASWITGNARRAVAMAALYGNLHIRAFADVDRKARLEGVKALLAVRDEFRDVVALQVVAFAQDGIVREPGADRLMREAMERGADVVGGIPWIEVRRGRSGGAHPVLLRSRRDIRERRLDAARRRRRSRHAHPRDDGEGSDPPRLAGPGTRPPLPGNGALSARGVRTPGRAPAARQRIGRERSPHRPASRAGEGTAAAGVNVCLGQDDIADAYYPFGRNNMLEVAFLAAHLLGMTARAEIETLYDMVPRRRPER